MSRPPLAAFLIIAFAVSWSLWAPLLLAIELPDSVRWLLYYAGVFGPAAAAFLCTRGGADRNALVHRILRWRVRARWYAVALLLPIRHS